MKKILLSFSLLAATAACSKDKTTATPGSEAVVVDAASGEAIGQEVPAANADAPESSSSTLTSNGEAPRRVLQLDIENLKFGSYTTRTVTTSSVGGQAITPPPFIIPVTYQRESGAADHVRVRMVTGTMRLDIDKNDPMQVMMAQAMAASTKTFDPDVSFNIYRNGDVRNVEFHTTDDNPLPPEALSALESGIIDRSANLPTVPLGKGATWTVSQTINLGTDEPFQVEAHYTLVELTNDGARLHVSIPAAEISMKSDGIDTAIRMEVVGEGTAHFRPNYVMPDSVMNMTVRALTPEMANLIGTTQVQVTTSADF